MLQEVIPLCTRHCAGIKTGRISLKGLTKYRRRKPSFFFTNNEKPDCGVKIPGQNAHLTGVSIAFVQAFCLALRLLVIRERVANLIYLLLSR